jgi:hypothetical protein
MNDILERNEVLETFGYYNFINSTYKLKGTALKM